MTFAIIAQGQTAFDVSEGEMVRLLEDLRKKQSPLRKDRSDIKILNEKGAYSPKKRYLKYRGCCEDGPKSRSIRELRFINSGAIVITFTCSPLRSLITFSNFFLKTYSLIGKPQIFQLFTECLENFHIFSCKFSFIENFSKIFLKFP